MSDEAKLSRMQHVRWWLGVGANCLFYQRFTVITQLPVVVPDDNSGLTVRLDLVLASAGTNFFDRVATLAEITKCHAEMAVRHSAAGKAIHLREDALHFLHF